MSTEGGGGPSFIEALVTVMSGFALVVMDWVRRGIRANTETHEALRKQVKKLSEDVSYLRGKLGVKSEREEDEEEEE